MSDKITTLAEYSSDARHWSPLQMLEDECQRIRENERCATKAIILFLDDRAEKYNTGFARAGMSMSQCVALLEIVKSRIISEEMAQE